MEVSNWWNVSLLALLAVLLATAPQALRRFQPWLAAGLTFLGATLLGATGLLLADVTRIPIAVGLSGVLSFYTILRQLSLEPRGPDGRRGALSVGFATVLRPYWYFQGGSVTIIAILGVVVATALPAPAS